MKLKRGRNVSRRNRSKRENIVRAGGCDFDGAFHMLLTFDLAEVEFLFNGSGVGPTVD
jgi:hypothetical protein